MCHNCFSCNSRNAIDRQLQATLTTRTTTATGDTGDTVTTAGLFPPHVVAWHGAIHVFPALSCSRLAILVFVCRYAAEPPRTSDTYIAQPAALPAIEARSPNPRRCGVRACVGGSVSVWRGGYLGCCPQGSWQAATRELRACIPRFTSLHLLAPVPLLSFVDGFSERF
jgi:hypothetical protein